MKKPLKVDIFLCVNATRKPDYNAKMPPTNQKIISNLSYQLTEMYEKASESKSFLYENAIRNPKNHKQFMSTHRNV